MCKSCPPNRLTITLDLPSGLTPDEARLALYGIANEGRRQLACFDSNPSSPARRARDRAVLIGSLFLNAVAAREGAA